MEGDDRRTRDPDDEPAVWLHPVADSLSGREALLRRHRAWRKVVSWLWLACGASMVTLWAAHDSESTLVGVLAFPVVLAGTLAPALTIIHVLRGIRVRRRLRELPSMPEARARRRSDRSAPVSRRS